MYFDPRTHIECDDTNLSPDLHNVISIHAPVWSATVHSELEEEFDPISIHAPVWGATD